MRKCQVTYKDYDKEKKEYGDEKTEPGLFHCWMQDGDNENGMSAVGLVEMSDGRIMEAYPTHIKFDVPDIKDLVPGVSLKEKRELIVWMFTGSVGVIEQDISRFMKTNNIYADRIFKVLQSECCMTDYVKCDDQAVDKGKKSITITIFYYKE